MKILSIDWDFFFPSQDWFDWAMSEENPFCFEAVWSTRCSSRHMKTGQNAVETMRPDLSLLEGFWDRVLEPSFLCIAESHKSLVHFLGDALKRESLEIWNVDAHHDSGYDNPKPLHCGNWVLHLGKRLKQFHQIYPAWRHAYPDRKALRPPDQTLFELPLKFEADILFVCRSSCWTPPWSDDVWLNFISGAQRFKLAWDTKKCIEWVMKPRRPNLAEAQSCREQWDRAQLELLHYAAQKGLKVY